MERSLLGQKDTLRAKTVAIRETMDAIKMLQKQRVREMLLRLCFATVAVVYSLVARFAVVNPCHPSARPSCLEVGSHLTILCFFRTRQRRERTES